MRALINTRFGGPEVLEVQELPDPKPEAGQVLVRVMRAGLTFADVSARVGLYPDAPKFPAAMGYEISGVVDTLGPGVTGFSKGDRVLAMTRFGGQATHICVPAAQLQHVPEQLSFEEAAALPVNYLTAYHMLFYVAPLRPGMQVLIHMAGGGVGLAAIQLARAVPEVTLFGTASTGKHEFLKKYGLDHPIDPRTTDYVTQVRNLTGGKGVHRVLDPLGGPDWAKGYDLLRSTGHLLCFGWANMVSGETRNVLRVASQFLQLKRYSPMDLMDKNRTVSGVNMGHLWHEQDLMTSHLRALLELAKQGHVKPHVDRVFKLAQGREAHEHVQGRRNIGKVLFDCE